MRCLILLVFLSFTFVNADISENLEQYQIGNEKFSIAVYKVLAKSEKENVLVCPVSVEIAMGMALVGARGETAKQISHGTHLSDQLEKLKSTFSELMPYLESNDKYNFELANKLYVRKTFHINQHYRQTIVNDFKGDIESIDMDDRSQAVSKMNQWVKEKSHSKIRDIIEKDDINEDTRLILLNALYFKGQWVTGFNSVHTKEHTFYLNKAEYVNVNMMTVKGEFNYYENVENKVRLLELPYKGDDVTMTIVLPLDPEELSIIEKKLDEIIVDPRQFFKRKVRLGLPKFNLKSSIKFKEVLKELGVNLPFKDGANFDGMIAKNQNAQLKIAEVLQKATIEVDEHGTVATAVAGVHMQKWKSARIFDEIYFYADHPFIFYLRHKVAGITFIGRYSRPPGSVHLGKYQEIREQPYRVITSQTSK
ncbi:hypothetical protein FQA39_LY00438 [Lamprigera yunnana]|nr:hypothetical protein FQA39_LY00438 [Lamprigera yunnana]